MALVQIPTLSGDKTRHTYSQTVAIMGVPYQAVFRWSNRRECWTLDLTTTAGEAMITGQAVLLGVDMLVYCVPKLRPRGVLVALWTNDEETAYEAGERDLGERVKLYHYERPADLEDPTEPTEPRLL